MNTILVIDDDENIHTMFNQHLGAMGYNIINADGESNILQILENNCVDLVLLDQFMPGRDGIEVMEMIKHGPHLPVIMITAYGSIDLVLTFMQSGGVDFIEKPLDFDILNIKIQKAIAAAERLKKEIADRKRAEKQLLQAQKMEALGRLAGGIAHDFKNILSAILGHANMAFDHLPPDHPSKTYLPHVENAGRRATALINQVLTFNDQEDDKRKPMQMQPVIHDVLNNLRSALPDKINIISNICTMSDKVVATESKIHQVILNLCTNACEAIGDENGQLTINFRELSFNDIDPSIIPNMVAEKYVELLVKDTGKGMDSATMERIFEPYFTTRKQTGGTGWGLFIIHEIVKDLGGTITVTSKPGKGSTFCVYIPCSIQSCKREQIKWKNPDRVQENTSS